MDSFILRAASTKRSFKDKKFGFGGKKKGSKINNRKSTDDVSGFRHNRPRKPGGGKGGKSQRPGKNRRNKMKAKKWWDKIKSSRVIAAVTLYDFFRGHIWISFKHSFRGLPEVGQNGQGTKKQERGRCVTMTQKPCSKCSRCPGRFWLSDFFDQTQDRKCKFVPLARPLPSWR